MTKEKEAPKEPLSKEELTRRKAEITAFHKEQIKFLSTQFDYEDLLAKIEEARLRRVMAMMRHAQVINPEPEESEAQEPTPRPAMSATRTLKKEDA